jgi:arylsulfatase A-like enzyme/tetratricopeptide (TPR) repeat protein
LRNEGVPFLSHWRLSGGFLVALAILFSGCRQKPTVFPRASLVFISIDTLRADHLPAYGYRKVKTPAIDALRKDAVLFENAYSHVPLTLPSHVTVFTGCLPAANGVHDNLGNTLHKRVATLPETLKGAGYDTGGAVSAIVLTGSTGMARGFDFYDDAVEPTKPNQVLGRVQRAGGETAASLETWIAERSARPFFAFLHLYEPHTPYEAPEPFRSRTSDPYDGEVEASDAVVGGFLDFLKANGLYDGSLIVLFSDHGEGLGDHGEDEHGVLLYREVLHIPLLVKLPGSSRAGTSVAAPVGLTDLFPTALAALGLPSPEVPPGPLSLLSLTDEARAASGRSVFSETFFPRLHLGWSDLASLIDGRSHYIEGPRPEFFDLTTDPHEKTNLIEEKTPAFRALKLEMGKLDRRFTRPGAVDADQAAKLATLGYVGSAAIATGPLPDPKDRIGVVREIKSALGLFASDRNEEAAATFKRLLDASPTMVDLWDAYAQTLSRLGRYEESLAAVNKGLELSGELSLLVSAARLELLMGMPDRALEHALRAHQHGAPGADDVLAQTYLARGDLARAEHVAKSALRRSARSRLPHLILARVERARENLPAALAHVDEAVRKTSELRLAPMTGLQQLRGDILGRLERPREAESAFKAEIAAFPQNVEGHTGLALLYGAEGRIPDARRVLTEFLKDGSPPGAYLSAARALRIIGDREGAETIRRRGEDRGH